MENAKKGNDKTETGRTLYDLVHTAWDFVGPFGRAVVFMFIIIVAFYWGQGEYRSQLTDANKRLQFATTAALDNLEKMEALRNSRITSIQNEMKAMDAVRLKVEQLRKENESLERQKLASLLFVPLISGLRSDVNRFIDNVYAPYLIERIINRQYELSESSAESERRMSLFIALGESLKNDANDHIKEAVKRGFGILIDRVRKEVEESRAEFLRPLNELEQEIATPELISKLQEVSERTQSIGLYDSGKPEQELGQRLKDTLNLLKK